MAIDQGGYFGQSVTQLFREPLDIDQGRVQIMRDF